MAAPIEQSTKEKKKLLKKVVKLRETLAAKENIHVSVDGTKIICVCNGGLDNSVTCEELKSLFTDPDSAASFEVLMIPQKSYCFVSFENIIDSRKAYEIFNGYKLSKNEHRKNDVILYLLFVDKVPDSVSPSGMMPEGLVLLEDYISEGEAQQILGSINWDEDATKGMKAALKHRQVKHYGYEFKYTINNVDPDEPLGEEVPEIFRPLLEKLRSSGVIGHYPDQLTVNQYQPGQGIPPHVDTPSAFEDGLVSLSIGSQVLMEFRHPDGRHLSVLLPHRSVLVMTGESRYTWTHGITPRKSDIVPVAGGGLTLSPRGVRTSFTFRKITGIKPETNQIEGPQLPSDESGAAELEKLHVHQVYEEIADHFSGTRHSPWPHIAEFLRAQPPGSLLVDIGCGNGKYFGINKGLYELGSDRSFNLSRICQERNFQVYVGDVLAIPLREGTFDVSMCIAVIHHLSTQDRRQQAVRQLLKVLRPGGHSLIYVWAMEQELNKVKSKYLKKAFNTETHELQDAVRADIPSRAHECGSSTRIMDGDTSIGISAERKAVSDKENGDKEENVTEKNDSRSTCSVSSDDRSDCCLATESSKSDIDLGVNTHFKSDKECKPTQLEVHVNRTEFKQQDVLVPWQLRNKGQSKGQCASKVEGHSEPSTFHRFYHVFQKGELEDLCESTGMCKVVRSYYDQGNWAVVLEKT